MKRLFSAFTNRRNIGRGANTTTGDVSVTSRFWGFLAGRWADHKREVRIRDLRLRMQASYNVRDHVSVAHIGRQLFAECDAHSERQCKRMEKRLFDSLDPHAQSVFERARK